jgi:DNA-binding XRE family transcriptional regulator
MKDSPKYNALVRHLAAKVKELRMAKGYTQEEMAQRFGFNYRYYQKLESGTYTPNLRTIFRIAEVFKVKVRDLF